jgi:hypothetical protein
MRWWLVLVVVAVAGSAVAGELRLSPAAPAVLPAHPTIFAFARHSELERVTMSVDGGPPVELVLGGAPRGVDATVTRVTLPVRSGVVRLEWRLRDGARQVTTYAVSGLELPERAWLARSVIRPMRYSDDDSLAMVLDGDAIAYRITNSDADWEGLGRFGAPREIYDDLILPAPDPIFIDRLMHDQDLSRVRIAAVFPGGHERIVAAATAKTWERGWVLIEPAPAPAPPSEPSPQDALDRIAWLGLGAALAMAAGRIARMRPARRARHRSRHPLL